jgi:hypothetical protein
MVAEVTASPKFEGQTTVSELWASLPKFPSDPSVVGSSLKPLELHAASMGENLTMLKRVSELVAPTAARLSLIERSQSRRCSRTTRRPAASSYTRSTHGRASPAPRLS